MSDRDLFIDEKDKLLQKTRFLGICGTLAFLVTTLILSGTNARLPRVERIDYNKDGTLDYIITQKGKENDYFISRPNGTFEHCVLVTESGRGFLASTSDKGAFYALGHIQKQGTNLIYDPDRIFRFNAPKRN